MRVASRLRLYFSRALLYIIISNANVFLHLDAKKKKRNRLDCPRKVFIYLFVFVFTKAHCDPVMQLEVFVLFRLFSDRPDSLSKCEA